MSRWVPRMGLRWAALARVLFAGGLAAVVLSVLVVALYGVIADRSVRAATASWVKIYEMRLARIEQDWRLQVEAFARQIDYARLLERPAPLTRFEDPQWSESLRWERLTAFFDHQRAAEPYSMIVVTDASGRSRFRYGTLTLSQAVDAPLVDWLWVPELRELHRVIRTPVWLGADGFGELIVLFPLDERLTATLHVPGSAIALKFGDRSALTVDAAEFPELSFERSGTSSARWWPDSVLEASVVWPALAAIDRASGASEGEASARLELEAVPGPQLDIRAPGAALGGAAVWAASMTGALVLALILWLVLGRLITSLSMRITTLGQAVQREAIDAGLITAAEDNAARRPVSGSGQKDLERRKTSALARLATAGDEIGQVAATFSNLLSRLVDDEQERLAHLETLALLEEAVVETTCEGEILSVSPGWYRLIREDNPVGRSLFEFVRREDAGALMDSCRAATALTTNHNDDARAPIQFRVRLQSRRESAPTWVEGRFIALPGKSDRRRLRGVLRDVTQAHLYERQISHMALHDALTDLPNRVLLEDRVSVALRAARQSGRPIAICFIDLDHFKDINDTLGHKSGDALLLEFSRRLQLAVAAEDTFARWGGDEFVLLLADGEDEAAFSAALETLVSVATRPFVIDQVELRISVSIGVAVFPSDGETAERLFTQADRAMFVAKQQGRNQTVWVRDINRAGKDRDDLYLQARLSRAVEERRIRAVFQPIVRASDGVFDGIEVLARWEEPELGPISPAVFIPMAESLGLIREVGDQIFEQALNARVKLLAAGIDVPIAINVSKRQLFLTDFVRKAAEAVTDRGLDPRTIMFEITESVALMDVEHASNRVRDLADAGFRIAIDDFGTGYSSLSQLHELTAHELKIDISFVRRVHEPSGLALVKAILQIARTIGLETIAEGVEDEAAADRLRALGVDRMQGYLFARPLELDALRAWAHARAKDFGSESSE